LTDAAVVCEVKTSVVVVVVVVVVDVVDVAPVVAIIVSDALDSTVGIGVCTVVEVVTFVDAVVVRADCVAVDPRVEAVVVSGVGNGVGTGVRAGVGVGVVVLRGSGVGIRVEGVVVGVVVVG